MTGGSSMRGVLTLSSLTLDDSESFRSGNGTGVDEGYSTRLSIGLRGVGEGIRSGGMSRIARRGRMRIGSDEGRKKGFRFVRLRAREITSRHRVSRVKSTGPHERRLSNDGRIASENRLSLQLVRIVSFGVAGIVVRRHRSTRHPSDSCSIARPSRIRIVVESMRHV